MFMGIQRRDTRTHYSGIMYCTKEAYLAYKNELKDITLKQIPEMTKEKSIAREKGDLRENSEYDAAKHKLIELNARKRWIEERIEKCSIILEEQVKTDVIGFGCHVTMEDGEGITLAGEWDDIPEKGIISIESPLGLVLVNKKAGDTATLNGKTYVIKKVSLAEDLFGHYEEHHPKKVEDQDVVVVEEKKVLPPKEVLDTLFSMTQAGKEKDELVAFLKESGDAPSDIQPIAMDTLTAKGDVPSAIKALNAINDWCRMVKMEG